MPSPSSIAADSAPGAFAFGRNWRRFLSVVDERRIEAAVESLSLRLGRDSLKGVRFLDAGSGSGLFSLAAQRLGATVVSFDVDPQSVACTTEMK
ncbi:MAG: 50S ribosomal protein L11 methyltransferase, partial [Planctomycetaceae bacterium]|nr:50S ribosomal protein L11 methyltransferase [Planctomycetaceae bacterium]